MNEQRLQEIKQRAEKATSGPWKVYQDAISTSIGTEFIHPQLNGPMPVITDAYHVGGAINIYIDDADAEFIAHARQDVPALVAEIERLQNTIALHEVNKRNLDAMIEHKDAEIERLRKALEFYADKENWERHFQCEIDVRQGQTLPIWDPSAIEFDEGETARRALAGDNQ